MESISKVSVIVKSYEDTILGNIPSDPRDYPSWYKERMDACETCEHNSKNMSIGDLSPKVWMQKMIGKNSCNICGCLIRQKAWMKTEVCGLHERGDKPKWNSISIITTSDYDFNVESMNTNISLSVNDKYNMIDVALPDMVSGAVFTMGFILDHKERFEIKEINAGCNCLSSNSFNMDDSNKRGFVNILFNTSNISEGDYVRSLTVKSGIIDDRFSEDDKMVDKFLSFRFIGKIIK